MNFLANFFLLSPWLDPEDGDHDDKNRPDTGEGDGGDEFVPVKKGKEKKTEGKRSLRAVSRAFPWGYDLSY